MSFGGYISALPPTRRGKKSDREEEEGVTGTESRRRNGTSRTTEKGGNEKCGDDDEEEEAFVRERNRVGGATSLRRSPKANADEASGKEGSTSTFSCQEEEEKEKEEEEEEDMVASRALVSGSAGSAGGDLDNGFESLGVTNEPTECGGRTFVFGDNECVRPDDHDIPCNSDDSGDFGDSEERGGAAAAVDDDDDDDDEEMATTTLLPPPPSWFVFGEVSVESGVGGGGFGGHAKYAEDAGLRASCEGGRVESRSMTGSEEGKGTGDDVKEGRRTGQPETDCRSRRCAAISEQGDCNPIVIRPDIPTRSAIAVPGEIVVLRGEGDDGPGTPDEGSLLGVAGVGNILSLPKQRGDKEENAASSSAAISAVTRHHRSKSCPTIRPPSSSLSSSSLWSCSASASVAAATATTAFLSSARHHASVTLPLAARELISSAFRRAYHQGLLAYYSGGGSLGFGRGVEAARLGWLAGSSSAAAAARAGWGRRRLPWDMTVPPSYRRATDLGNNAAGYLMDAVAIVEVGSGEVLWDGTREEGERGECTNGGGRTSAARRRNVPELRLPPFSSLCWVDRQLVKEWRTFDVEPDGERGGSGRQRRSSTGGVNERKRRGGHSLGGGVGLDAETDSDQCDDDDSVGENAAYDAARTIAPRPLPCPPRENASSCYACRRSFSSTLLRHHCRLCGRSYCHPHSAWEHRLPHLGYDADVAERVCAECKAALEARDLAERIAWRMARCRDHLDGNLVPYFETGIDTAEDAALRLARAAIAMAKSIPLGAQATVAVETIDVLRKHGLKGVYGLILRKEFLAAADLLCRVTGINRRAWPLSVHELSAAVFYALAQHRLLRGMDPEREHRAHSLKEQPGKKEGTVGIQKAAVDAGESGGGGKSGQVRVAAASSEDLGKEKEVATPLHPLYEEKDRLEDDEEGGDTIVWGMNGVEPAQQRTPSACGNSALNETDNFDPLAESIADMLTIANREAAEMTERRTGVNLKVALQERDAGPDGIFITAVGRCAQRDADANGGITCPIEKVAAPIVREDNAHSEGRPRKPSSSFDPVCEYVDDALLSSLIFYAPIALNFIYATSATDMQLLAAQQGWRLLYAHLEQETGSHSVGRGGVADRPASALFVHDDRKIACFAVRGTATINDVVTDIRAMPVPFPPESEEFVDCGDKTRNGCVVRGEEGGFDDDWTPVFRGQGLALCGMAGASVNLFRENVDSLLLLARKGYKIRFVGHSLGGGVAALLGSLVRRHFERRVQRGDDGLFHAVDVASVESVPTVATEASEQENEMERRSSAPNPFSAEELEKNNLLRVYSYGSPACVDAKLADYARSYVTNCVMHDDVVPRLNPTSIRALLKHLLYIRETWVKVHLGDDVTAYAERVRKAWAPRWRQSFTMLKSSSRSSLRKCKRRLRSKVGHAYQRSAALLDGKSAVDKTVECRRREDFIGHQSKEETSQHICADSPASSDIEGPVPSLEVLMPQNGLVNDVDDGGVPFDGDFFYEAEENLLETDDEEDSGGPSEKSVDNAGHERSFRRQRAVDDEEWVPFDEPAMDMGERASGHEEKEIPNDAANDVLTKENSKTESTPAVVLDETPLPRMFIPGKIVHIYTHRGAYKAAFVPRQFRELRRISLAGNMLSDHTSMAYYEGMLEVKAVRKAEFELPEWTGFGEEITCLCCASRFTWASTSDSEAQEARDKHNCRACGGLVCDPCSKNRIALPFFGINVAVRVCDRCYNDMGAILMGDDGQRGGIMMERSCIGVSSAIIDNDHCRAKSVSSCTSQYNKSKNDKFTGQGKRKKRNSVVDELASRIPTVPTC